MKKTVLYILAIFILSQFIQTDKTKIKHNQDTELKAPKEVISILKRSCYDCHSFETKWPKYSYVAPISWVVSANVHNGRDALNFDTWTKIDPAIKKARLKRLKHLVDIDMMPKDEYLLIHKDAKLSSKGKEVLVKWVESIE